MQRSSSDESYITSFKQVLYRHGGTMSTLAALGLMLTLASKLLNRYASDFLTDPTLYLIAGTIICVFFILFLRFRKWELNKSQLLWIAYLLGISIVEEIAFRLTIPFLIMGVFGGFLSVLLSNLVFALIHYVTLRWKLIPCVFTFMGGIGFSRLLENSENIVLVILVHWFVTFLNTPRPPKILEKN